MKYVKVVFSFFALVMAILLTNEACFADDALYIDANGNVGIGTTSLGEKLDVVGSMRCTVATDRETFTMGQGDLQFLNTDTTYEDGVLAISFGHKTSGVWADSAIVSFAESAGNTRLGFYTENGNYGAERVTIANNGNVGIGTNSPVYGSTGANPILHISGNAPGFRLEETDSGTGDWDILANGGKILIRDNKEGSSGTRLVINQDGNFGIGTTNPSHKLYVVGNIYATGSITPGSSRDLKNDIRPLSLEEAISALEDLMPTKFRYKADKDEEHLGFIAEDVPALVATNDRKGLSPMDIVAVLTKVVQKQQQEIEALKAQMNKK